MTIRRSTLKTPGRCVALVVAVTIGLATVGSSTAYAATPVSSSGTVGIVKQPDSPGTTCTKTAGFMVDPTTTGSTVSPQVYGINLTSGVDKQYVTWRIRVINKATGATVATSPWAPNQLAADNAPVRWSNMNWTVPDAIGNYVVQSDVWWYYGGAWRSRGTLQISNYSVTYNTYAGLFTELEADC